MKMIAVLNCKGGVAKTTTTVNLAAILAHDFGRKVLVVDADAQANATGFLGGDGSRPGMAAMLRREQSSEKPIELQRTNVEGVSLVAADSSLMALDLTQAGNGGADAQCLRKLRAVLEQTERPMSDAERVIYGDPYDVALIDCPPAFNAASTAALIAADAVLIPMKLDAFALDGMANLMEQVRNMRTINGTLRVLGVLPVMWYRADAIQKAESALRNAGLRVLPRIRRSDRVDDMTYYRKPLIACSPKSGACRDYRVLAGVLDREEVRSHG